MLTSFFMQSTAYFVTMSNMSGEMNKLQRVSLFQNYMYWSIVFPLFVRNLQNYYCYITKIVNIKSLLKIKRKRTVIFYESDD